MTWHGINFAFLWLVFVCCFFIHREVVMTQKYSNFTAHYHNGLGTFHSFTKSTAISSTDTQILAVDSREAIKSDSLWNSSRFSPLAWAACGNFKVNWLKNVETSNRSMFEPLNLFWFEIEWLLSFLNRFEEKVIDRFFVCFLIRWILIILLKFVFFDCLVSWKLYQIRGFP